MTSITIRDVPEQTRNELASRAAKTGRSLQEYLRVELDRLADRPEPEEVFGQIRERRRRSPSRLTAGDILQFKDEDRR